jgi:polar amino acid transport system substrate-binding protein
MKKVAFLICSALISSYAMAAERIVLTSLEWPPYTGTELKEQGASVAVAKAAFAAMGYELVVEFYPWKRAVHLAKSDPNYAGYFPEYYSDELKTDFILSQPIGSGPLGFAELKSNPILWNSLDDLKDKKIGVVNGYMNTEEFDKRVAEGSLQASPVTDDLPNLRKLSSKRIDLAVIDQNVMEYLLNTAPELAKTKHAIQFNSKILEDKQLYICFKKGPRGEELTKIFNEGLTKIDADAIMKNYLQ